MTKPERSNLANVVLLFFGICFAQSGVQAGAGSELVFEHSFDASASIGETPITTFDVPSEGRFRITTINPDLSADGYFGVLLKEGAITRLHLQGTFFGYTGVPAYHGSTVVGLNTRVFEFSVKQEIANLGSLTVEFFYVPNGIENTGTNTVLLEYLPEPIDLPGAPILSISSGRFGTACQPPIGTVRFDAGDGGTLILRKTSIGAGGGGHELYVDGLGFGYSLHAGAQRTPESYVVKVGPGVHDVRVCHNDDYFLDNSGTRAEELYFDGGEGVDLTVSSLRLAQVVFDPDINDDSRIDLVLQKPAVAIVTISASGADPADMTPVAVELSFGGRTADTETIKLGEAAQGGVEVELFFTPSIVGDLNVEVVVDSGESVPEADESNNAFQLEVSAKDTGSFRVVYRPVIDCSGPFDCYDPPSSSGVTQAIANANEFLVATFPVAAPEFEGAQGLNYSGDPIPGFGALDDAISLTLHALLTGRDRAVGLVSSSYFDHHNLNVAGVTWPGLRGVLVREGLWTLIAHELGHTYGLPLSGSEEYVPNNDGSCCAIHGNPASGFWVSEQTDIVDSICLMGSGPFADLTTRWIEQADFEHLFRKFREDASDPEILILAGLFHADGALELRDWYAMQEGVLGELPPGDKVLQFVDLSGDVLSEISFAISFIVYEEFVGPRETDVAPFAFAVEYPAHATSVQILDDDVVIAEMDLSGKLLHDAVQLLPAGCFDHPNPEVKRNTLQNKIDALEAILDQGNLRAAINKLTFDIRDKLEAWLIDGCVPAEALQMSKDEVLDLATILLTRLEAQHDLDADGVISVSDLLELLSRLGVQSAGPPDFDGDRLVGVTDLLQLLGRWGTLY